MRVPAELTTPPVSRTAIAWVCVATNDAHPLHLDHQFAQNAGFRDVVVPGHILIGWIGQYLQDWCGDPRNLLGWSIRFTAPVWPDETFTLRGEIADGDTEADGDIRAVTVTATTRDGKIAAKASARLRLAAA